jgi:hypothetical protein
MAVNAMANTKLARFARRCRNDGLLLSVQGVPEVDVVESHQRLPPTDLLSGADEPLQDLACDAEAQVTLHSRGDRSGERARQGGPLALNDGSPHQRRLRSRIVVRRMAARGQEHRQAEGEERGKMQECASSSEHRYLSDDELDDTAGGVLAHGAAAR